MIITKKNINKIMDISLHDAYFEEVIYNNTYKEITIKLESEWGNVDYILEFHTVLYYEMVCCDFWGGGYNVVCWSRLDTTSIFDKLLRLQVIEQSRSKGTSYSPMDLYDYFGIEILLNSGDKLKIICKEIGITEIAKE